MRRKLIIAYPYKVEQDFYTVINDDGYEEELSFIRIWAKDINNNDIILSTKRFHPYLYVKGKFNIQKIKDYASRDVFFKLKELPKDKKDFFFKVINTIQQFDEPELKKVFIQAYYEKYVSKYENKIESAIIEMLKYGVGDEYKLLKKLSKLKNKSYVKKILNEYDIKVAPDWEEKIKNISDKDAEEYPVMTREDFKKVTKLYRELKDLVVSYLALIVTQQYLKKEVVMKKELITTSILSKLFSKPESPSDEEIEEVIRDELSEYNIPENKVQAIKKIIKKMLSMVSEPKTLDLQDKYSMNTFNNNFEKFLSFYEQNKLFDRISNVRGLLMAFSNLILGLSEQEFTKVYFKSTKKFKLIRTALKLFGYDTREDNIQFELRYMIDSKIKFTWNIFKVYEGVKTKRGNRIYILEDYNSFRPLTHEEIKMLNLPEQPKFKALYFDIEVYNKKTMNVGEAPIVAIGTLLVTYYESKPVYGEYKVFYNLDAENSEFEKRMLEAFLKYIKSQNIDMIIGFNSNQYDLPFIVKRAEQLGIKLDISKLGNPPVERVSIKETREGQGFSMEYKGWSIDGIIVIDVLRLAERDIVGVQRYNLKDLADELGLLPAEERVIIKGSELWKAWDEIPELVLQYLEHDVLATYMIYDKTLRELQEELVRLLNKDLQYIVFIKTSKLVESRILDKAHEKGYIMPRKKSEKGGYSGALVLPPRTGKIIGVSVDDYASLYPNIIITYNISLETFIGHISMEWVWKLLGYKPDSFIEYFILEQIFFKLGIGFIIYYDVSGEDYQEVITAYQRALSVYLFRRDVPGFISETLKEILERRLEVKKKMKETTDPKLKQKLNIEQLGLKKLANSFYGYLGYINSLIFRTEIAEAVTSGGKMTNYHTVMVAITSGKLTPVYGDTDSSMFISSISSKELAEVLPDEVDLDSWINEQFIPTTSFFEKLKNYINKRLN